MFSFKQFIIEKLITFTRRAGGIPKSENVVFLAGGAGCFYGDTLVKTTKGYKPIKEILEGEQVYTQNEKTGETEIKQVQKCFEYNAEEFHEDILELKFDNGEVVRCTENHEFFIDGQWIKAKDIPIL
jgi:hypothetical protein